MKKDKISTKFFIDKRRIRKSDNKYPLKLRIIHKRKSYELKLNFYFSEKEFYETMNVNARGRNKKNREIINSILSEVNKIIEEMSYFDIKLFKNKLFNTKSNKVLTVYDCFDEKIKEMKKSDKIKSAALYNVVKNNLYKFSGDSNLSFNKIDVVFLKEFDIWLKKNDASQSTVFNYMRYIRAIFNYADVKEYYNKTKQTYPFGKYKYEIGASSYRNIALTKDQLDKFKKIETIPFSFRDMAKDFWIFSMQCGGMNFIDMAYLTNDNIDYSNKTISFIRKKTSKTFIRNGKKITIPLDKTTLAIIKKWKPKNSNFIFPILDKIDKESISDINKVRAVSRLRLRTLNKHTKKMGEEIGLDFPLTSYVARHTFASLMLKAKNSPEFIAEFTGHTDLKSLKHYLSGFDNDDKRKAIQNVFE